MLLDELRHALLLPPRQAATKPRRRAVCRSFRANEFVHQHEAQGLAILAARRIGVPDFGLELEGSVPDRLIEEEQARADLGGGGANFRIKQSVLQIDVEIGNARQYPRRLPPVEPMPRRHEAQLAIELAQRRFGQALDKRLAFISLCPLVNDQQRSPGLKAVFESAAPGHLYRVCLDCAPMCQSAAHDIGRRNFNDRSMRRMKARRVNAAAADSFHRNGHWLSSCARVSPRVGGSAGEVANKATIAFHN